MKISEDLPGILNSDPSNCTHESCYDRVSHDYTCLCEKYLHKKKEFNRQFFHIYAARLNGMKDNVIAKAVRKWGKDVPVTVLAALQEQGTDKSIIVGTLFKHQQLKPSILKEISEEFQLVPQQKQTRFFSDDDELILEDELQRIKLIGRVDIESTVTGIVCAALGTQDESGKFLVEDICWAGPAQVPSPSFTPLKQDKFVVLVSGLDFSHSADLLPVRLLADYLTGWLGEPQLQRNASAVSLVIIAGNSVRATHSDKDGKVVNTEVKSCDDISTTLSSLDQFLSQLSRSVEVDLLPGEFDPTNYQLPQQPLHMALFQQAGRLKSFRSVTNPYMSVVDGRVIAGSSGQPVDDVAKYGKFDDCLSTLEATLRWGHFAPTAPDTLACYPYYDTDPFIMDCQPDVYFAGNQETFATKVVEIDHANGAVHRTRLISVPQFSKTGTCVRVSLNSLECQPLSFKVNNLS